MSNESADAIDRAAPRASLDLRVPYITADLPGIGGTIKAIPDDFIVQEIPSYAPDGSGEHLFVWIEKRGVASEHMVRHIAESLGIPAADVGVAGMKDRQAITRQFVSVPRRAEHRVASINTPEIRVLDVRAHSNKLRTGHLRGNQFTVLVRDVLTDAARRSILIRDKLADSGMPNFFGAQRFGRDQETAALGLELMRGQTRSLPGHWSRKRFLRKLAISAGQAVLFNHYLTERTRDGLLHIVLDGDVMFKIRPRGGADGAGPPASGSAAPEGSTLPSTGGIFYVSDQRIEQLRFDARETVHAGPIFGSRMFAAHGTAADREAAVLTHFGIDPSEFHRFGQLASGTRRANLVYLHDLAITPLPRGIEFRFTLPSGSYATVLLDEFMKTPVSAAHEVEP